MSANLEAVDYCLKLLEHEEMSLVSMQRIFSFNVLLCASDNEYSMKRTHRRVEFENYLFNLLRYSRRVRRHAKRS